MTPREDIAYSEAVRALDEQRATVDTLQSRAGVLLAAGAIVNVALGNLAFSGHQGWPLPPLSMGGAVCASVAFGALIFLVWPHKYGFTLPAEWVLDSTTPFDTPDESIVSQSVRTMEARRAMNHDRLGRLTLVLQTAIGALVVNAAAWALVAQFGGR